MLPVQCRRFSLIILLAGRAGRCPPSKKVGSVIRGAFRFGLLNGVWWERQGQFREAKSEAAFLFGVVKNEFLARFHAFPPFTLSLRWV